MKLGLLIDAQKLATEIYLNYLRCATDMPNLYKARIRDQQRQNIVPAGDV